jgi:hypothetical protein
MLYRIRDGLKVEPTLGGATGIALLARTSEGRIWVSRRGQLSLLEHGRLNAEEPAQMAISGYVHGLCASHDGGVWVLCEGRLRKWKDRAWVADLGIVLRHGAGRYSRETPKRLAGGRHASSGLFCFRPEALERPSLLPDHRFSTTGLSPARTVKVGCGYRWAARNCAPRRVQTAVPPDRWRGCAAHRLSWSGWACVGLARAGRPTTSEGCLANHDLKNSTSMFIGGGGRHSDGWAGTGAAVVRPAE